MRNTLLNSINTLNQIDDIEIQQGIQLRYEPTSFFYGHNGKSDWVRNVLFISTICVSIVTVYGLLIKKSEQVGMTIMMGLPIGGFKFMTKLYETLTKKTFDWANELSQLSSPSDNRRVQYERTKASGKAAVSLCDELSFAVSILKDIIVTSIQKEYENDFILNFIDTKKIAEKALALHIAVLRFQSEEKSLEELVKSSVRPCETAFAYISNTVNQSKRIVINTEILRCSVKKIIQRRGNVSARASTASIVLQDIINDIEEVKYRVNRAIPKIWIVPQPDVFGLWKDCDGDYSMMRLMASIGVVLGGFVSVVGKARGQETLRSTGLKVAAASVAGWAAQEVFLE